MPRHSVAASPACKIVRLIRSLLCQQGDIERLGWTKSASSRSPLRFRRTRVEQSYAKAKARELFGGRKELFDRLAGVFDNAGIAQRHIVAPTDWYEGHHGWKERNRRLSGCMRRAVPRGGDQRPSSKRG